MTEIESQPLYPVPSLRVIARDEHGLSRKQMSQNALRVLYRLREAGFGGYLVGGAVRDLLVGGAPKDYDVATDATPEQVKSLFRNCRLIGRRFRLAHVVYGREIIEVATFRANIDDGSGDREQHEGGRLLRDNVYGTIEDDAIRRDFTANALYYAIEDFSVRDYVGGYDDVQARLLRLIGDPEARYREDPVRMLRAARLAAKLDFSIEAATAEPIARLAPLLAEAAPARLFEETLKMFLSGHAVASFEQLEAHGLLPALLPETAQALASNKSGALRRMLVQGLRNTDARVAADESVSPAFLYAVLLWPAYCRALALLQAQGVHAADAQRRAADRVTLHQVGRTALPRRFSLPMRKSGCCSRASRSACASACSGCWRIRASAPRSISWSCAWPPRIRMPRTWPTGARRNCTHRRPWPRASRAHSTPVRTGSMTRPPMQAARAMHRASGVAVGVAAEPTRRALPRKSPHDPGGGGPGCQPG